MDFELTREQTTMRDRARDFAGREIAPQAAVLDKTARWPSEIITRMAEEGLMSVAVPRELGGAGLDTMSYVLAMEEISAACASCGAIMSVNNSLFCDPLVRFGTPSQKAILRAAAVGAKLGAFGLTEPMSGSDAQTMATHAEKVPGGWVLNGSKNWVTNGPYADYILAFAATHRDPSKTRKTAFLVEKGTPGLSLGPIDSKLGIHAAHSCTVGFDGCQVSDSAVVGEVGEGFKVAMVAVEGARIAIAAQAVGIARAAFESALAYAKERQSFGVSIAQHQAIQFMLADMATQLDAARLLTWQAALARDAGAPVIMKCAEAKLYASEMATRVAHKALQIYGGYGYSTDLPAERHYRDARITEIYVGTSEIQRIIIAANLLR